MVDCDALPAGEPVPSSCRPVRAGRPAMFRLTDVERTSLEAEGSQVDQTAAVTMRETFLQFARDAGAVSPPAGVDALGGDFVAIEQFTATGYVVLLADWLVGGNGVVNAQDFYTGGVLPIRNGAITMDPLGDLDTHIYRDLGTTPMNWLDPQINGGRAAGVAWWTVGSVRPNLAGTDWWVVAHELIDDPESPTGGVYDTAIIRVGTVLPTYVSDVLTGWGPAGNFWLGAIGWDPVNNFIYGTGVAIDYDQPIVAPTDWAGHAQSHGLGLKIGRATAANGSTPAAWQFWNGSAWVSDVTQATAMTDERGRIIQGLNHRPHRVGPNQWVITARLSILDPCLTVFSSRLPQGPWRPTCRVAVPGMGGEYQPDVRWVSHHSSIIPDVATLPDDCKMAMLTNRSFGPSVNMLDNKIQREMPSFVVFPVL